MNPDTAGNGSSGPANVTHGFLHEVERLVGDLSRVSNGLTALASHWNGGFVLADDQSDDDELQLLRSLAGLQRARCEISLLEHAIRALDAEIDSAASTSEHTVPKERASS